MQVAIVTGASSGIGFGCATKLAEQGMAVLGTGRDEARLAELKAQRLKIEHKVVLLRPESIDPDKLDEEARAMLGFVHANDRSIPIDRSTGEARFAD